MRNRKRNRADRMIDGCSEWTAAIVICGVLWTLIVLGVRAV